MHAAQLSHGAYLIACRTVTPWCIAYRMPRSYPMVRSLSHAAQLWHGLRSLCTVQLNREWFVEVTPLLQQQIRGMAESSYAATFVTFEMASNGYVTWHSPMQVIATCCESAHVRGVGCNVLGIWNVVVT